MRCVERCATRRALRGTFTLKDTGWVEAATRRKGKAESKIPPLHNPQGWGTQILSSVTRLGHPPSPQCELVDAIEGA
jgi:hypothetical protein